MKHTQTCTHEPDATRDETIFTVNVDGTVHRCSVSVEVLYMLCQHQDHRLDRIDAYIELKARVNSLVRRFVHLGGNASVPPLIEARHLIDC